MQPQKKAVTATAPAATGTSALAVRERESASVANETNDAAVPGYSFTALLPLFLPAFLPFLVVYSFSSSVFTVGAAMYRFLPFPNFPASFLLSGEEEEEACEKESRQKESNRRRRRGRGGRNRRTV